MAVYFFDFRLGDIVSIDEEGHELSDAEAAHNEAIGALADAIQDVVAMGEADQDVAVEVRDELGPVLQVTALLGSKILRKQ
jgi:hypothetical protein